MTASALIATSTTRHGCLATLSVTVIVLESGVFVDVDVTAKAADVKEIAADVTAKTADVTEIAADVDFACFLLDPTCQCAVAVASSWRISSVLYWFPHRH